MTIIKSHEPTKVKVTVKVPDHRGLLKTIKQRKSIESSNWKRMPDSLVLATIEGEGEGPAKRGRRRKAWIDGL